MSAKRYKLYIVPKEGELSLHVAEMPDNFQKKKIHQLWDQVKEYMKMSKVKQTYRVRRRRVVEEFYKITDAASRQKIKGTLDYEHSVFKGTTHPNFGQDQKYLTLFKNGDEFTVFPIKSWVCFRKMMVLGPDTIEDAEQVLESNIKKGKIKLKNINKYYEKKTVKRVIKQKQELTGQDFIDNLYGFDVKKDEDLPVRSDDEDEKLFKDDQDKNGQEKIEKSMQIEENKRGRGRPKKGRSKRNQKQSNKDDVIETENVKESSEDSIFEEEMAGNFNQEQVLNDMYKKFIEQFLRKCGGVSTLKNLVKNLEKRVPSKDKIIEIIKDEGNMFETRKKKDKTFVYFKS